MRWPPPSAGFLPCTVQSATGADIAAAVFEPLEPFAADPAPPVSRPNCLLIHGYGGCKEDLFGLALRITQSHGMRCAVADLPGHGESGGSFSLTEVRSALAALDAFDPELAVGHSVGGRILAHLSNTPRLIAISPPMRTEVQMDRRTMLTFLRPARVREEAVFSGLRDCLDHFGDAFGHAAADGDSGRRVLVIRAANDLRSVEECVSAWTARPNVDGARPIPASNHIDVLTHPMTWERVKEWLDAR